MGFRNRKDNPFYASRPKRHRGLKIAAIILLIVVLCAVVGVFLLPKWMPGLEIFGTDPTESTEPTEPTESKPDQVIHLIAGGDLNVTDKTVAAGLQGGAYDYTEVFRDVLPILSSGDVTMLNFEGTFGSTAYGSETKTPPPELLQSLSKAGVDMLQTANTCSIFGGLRGLQSTISAIQGAGMTPVGTFADENAFQKSGGYLIWDIKGIKVAFLAFTKGMDGMGLPPGSENCVNLLYEDYNTTYQKVDKERITRVIQNAKAHQPDLIVAMLHWGSEFNDKVSSSQQKICEIMQEEGVNAIIGTHSHYVQKIEHDPETGAFVAYSLGDFFGDAEKAGTNYSILLDLEITKDGNTGKTKVTGFDCVPVFIHEDETGAMRVLRIREAIEGFESNYIGSVSDEIYNAMKNALGRIADRTGIKDEREA